MGIITIFNLQIGTTGAYQEKLEKLKSKVYFDVKAQANKIGANAIIGTDIEYSITPQNMIMLAISGTPVLLGDEEAQEKEETD